MARTARFLVPGLPHHITHRGNLRADMFFADSDRVFYLDMLRQCCDRFKVHVWAYCCMTNHVHLIVVPETEQGLSRALGLAHQRYSSATNARHGWTGSLWANRFYSSPLDESHLWKAVKYVELNPVRANMVLQATDYPWSSARCHAGIEGEVGDRPLKDCPAGPSVVRRRTLGVILRLRLEGRQGRG